MDFSQDGNMANSVNGNANARAKPTLPVVETSTNKKPMIGPVHENETKDRVNAIRKILNKPLVCSALLSTALLHFEGRVSSNAPKKEAANTISIKQKNMLKIAFVESAFKALAPNIKVMARPNNT